MSCCLYNWVFEKYVIIDDVNSKLPFLSWIFEASWSMEKRYHWLRINARIGSILFDIIQYMYVKYAANLYLCNYCVHT